MTSDENAKPHAFSGEAPRSAMPSVEYSTCRSTCYGLRGGVDPLRFDLRLEPSRQWGTEKESHGPDTRRLRSMTSGVTARFVSSDDGKNTQILHMHQLSGHEYKESSKELPHLSRARTRRRFNKFRGAAVRWSTRDTACVVSRAIREAWAPSRRTFSHHDGTDTRYRLRFPVRLAPYRSIQ